MLHHLRMSYALADLYERAGDLPRGPRPVRPGGGDRPRLRRHPGPAARPAVRSRPPRRGPSGRSTVDRLTPGVNPSAWSRWGIGSSRPRSRRRRCTASGASRWPTWPSGPGCPGRRSTSTSPSKDALVAAAVRREAATFVEAVTAAIAADRGRPRRGGRRRPADAGAGEAASPARPGGAHRARAPRAPAHHRRGSRAPARAGAGRGRGGRAVPRPRRRGAATNGRRARPAAHQLRPQRRPTIRPTWWRRRRRSAGRRGAGGGGCSVSAHDRRRRRRQPRRTSRRRAGRDRKRYLWPAGLLVPLLPLLAAWLAGDGGWVGWWFAGPIVVFGVIPLLDTAFGRDTSNPPEACGAVARGRPVLPVVHLAVPAAAVRRVPVGGAARGPGRPVGGRLRRPGADGGHGRRHRHQHRPRARAQAGPARAPAVEGGTGAERLRPLLRRAQPRPPRQRVDARGSGQRPARRVVLAVPAPHRRRQPALGLVARGGGPGPQGPAGVVVAQRRAQRLGADRGAVRRHGRLVRPAGGAVPRHPGGAGVRPARGRELHRALRAAAPAGGQRALRALPARRTAGTATTSPRTSSSTTSNATPITTPTRPAATRRCGTSTRHRSCPRATR